MKEVLKEIIEILSEELASSHRYTECTCDPEPECLDGSCDCGWAWKCHASYKLEQRFDGLLNKLAEMV